VSLSSRFEASKECEYRDIVTTYLESTLRGHHVGHVRAVLGAFKVSALRAAAASRRFGP